MKPVAVSYASSSVVFVDASRAMLGLTANSRRPVSLHAKMSYGALFLRQALRAFGALLVDARFARTPGPVVRMDPLVTVHPDALLLEAFTTDCDAYAAVRVDKSALELEQEMACGTSSFDFTPWFCEAVGDLRSSRATFINVDVAGFDDEAPNGATRYERTIGLSSAWVRGFGRIHSRASMPGECFDVRPVDMLTVVRTLLGTRSMMRSGALRYVCEPDADVRIVVEPFEAFVELRGATHTHRAPQTTRAWGRHRLGVLELLLPYADSMQVHLRGTGQPSYFTVRMPGVTFVLAVTDGEPVDAAFAPKATDVVDVPPEILAPVLTSLVAHRTSRVREVVADTGMDVRLVERGLRRLCHAGRAAFDISTLRYRHRELFELPMDLKMLDERSEEATAALMHLEAGRVVVGASVKRVRRKRAQVWTPRGDEEGTWEVEEREVNGAVEQEGTRIVLCEDRICDGTCTCVHFREYGMSAGPCEHMLALLVGFRADEPLSSEGI